MSEQMALASRAVIRPTSVILPPHIIAKLDAEVERRRVAGKKANRSEVMRLAILAYTRPPIKRKAKKARIPREIVPVASESKWWRFWK